MILLDSHAVLWWLADDPRLPRTLVETMQASEVSVSAGSIWEIEIKRNKGSLEVPSRYIGILAAEGFGFLNIEPADAVEAAALPRVHGDPFDRMLVAQARRRGFAVATRDRHIAAYGVRTLWDDGP